MKTNCWEFTNCGRQMGGALSRDGVCPAATSVPLNGVHGGLFAGRACWVVKGTKCENQLQGTFGEKFKRCEQCGFYRTVMREEGTRFMLSSLLLERLRSEKGATARVCGEAERPPRAGLAR